MDPTVLYTLGLTLVIVGIIIVVIAIILLSICGAGRGKTNVKGAGVIMIGPIPIIFGTDKKSVKTVLVLALILTIALIIAWIVFYLLLR